MASTCPSCGEESVIWEEYSQQMTDGKPQQVCTECGLILEEGSYFAADGAEGTSDVKVNRHLYESSLPTSYLRRNKTETESKTKKACEKLIGSIGSLFDLPDDVIERSKELFRIIYKAVCFQSVAVETKKITAGCCLFAVCRMSDIPMLIKFFTDALSCRKEQFSSELKRLVHITDIKIPPQDISDYVSGYCRNLGMSDAVKSTTFDIIQVANNTWISQGRQTEHVLAAAVYIAWVAEEPTVRLKTKLQTFFKRNSANCPSIRVTRQRYVELVQVICKLAKEIPWVDVKEANLKTAVFNLKDVVSYQQSLLHEASARVCSDDHLESENKTICTKEERVESPPVTCAQSDVTIVARDLATNTTTTTGLSLVATVTEHTDLENLDLSNSREKEQCDSVSEGSSEGGHHYSIVVSQEKDKEDAVKMEGNCSSFSVSAQPSPQGQIPSEGTNNSAENQTANSKYQLEEDSLENVVSTTKTSSLGYRRQGSIVEGTVCVDQEGYDALKALGTCPVKSFVENSELTDDKSDKTKDEFVAESCHNAGETRVIKSSTSSQHSYVPYASNCCDAEVKQKMEHVSSNLNCDNITNQQRNADEFSNICDSKFSRTKCRKRKLEIQEIEILPSSFVLGRQISQEKRLKREDGYDPTTEDSHLAEVTIQEIDDDIEQYFRTDDEINFFKKIQAKK